MKLIMSKVRDNFKKLIKNLICLFLCVFLVSNSVINLRAATFEDINDSSVFLKQEGSSTCTLCAATMMLRRTAMLRGDSDWNTITESAVRSTAWIEGSGLKWSFTYSNITVAHASISGTEASKTEQLINLLEEHPEGIVLYYYSSSPHAVLLTDYTNGIFYCADPWTGKPSGRIPLSQCLYVTVANANYYWYVSSPKVSLDSSHNPVGRLDGIEGRVKSVYVNGWALDTDSMAESLYVHVYIGGPAGSADAEGYPIIADTTRSDVGNAYPGAGNNHGFDAVIPTQKTGDQPVYVYAINVGSGDNTLLWNGTVSIPSVATGSQTISDGRYHIVSALNSSKVLGVDESSKENNANISLWSSLDDPDQTFDITYMGNGYYTIINTNSGKSMDVQGSGITDGTNVLQYSYTGTDNQQWVIQVSEDGSYYNIVSKYNGLYLDVASSNEEDGTNIEVWKSNNGTHQKWKFIAFGEEDGQTIADGDYHIASALDSNQTLDVYGGSTENEANIQLYNSIENPMQAFQVTYLGDGYYKILNIKSGKCLDIPGGTGTSGSNVQQYEWNGANGQQWIIRDAGDGYYNIISKWNGMYLDATNGQCTDGTNVEVWVGHSGLSQKWEFIPLSNEKNCAVLSVSECAAIVGETVDVYINLQDNPGIVGATLGLEYDSAKLELLSCNDLGILNDFQSSDLSNNPFLMNWEDALAEENNTANGDIVKLQFKVLEDPGDQGIDLILTVDTIYDVNIEDVEYTVTNGKISKRSYLPGDVNDDGVINSKDSILLRKYILGNDVTINKDAADVNKDGVINSKDSILLRKYILGADVELK